MTKTKDSVSQQSNENNGYMIGTNYGNIYKGMDYVDVRNLCLDLIEEEVNKAKQIALEEAKRRDSELITLILEKAASVNISPDSIMAAMEEPALQFDIIEAERSYIKYGTEELKGLLANLIVKRIKESNHSLLQIALGEAIKTSSMLLPTQINCLGLKFVLNHTYRTTVNSYEALAEYLNNCIIPIYEHGVSEKLSEFQHLSYTRCATISVASSCLENIFTKKYTGLFFKGFDEQSLTASDNKNILSLYPTLFTTCLNDDKKLQLNAINYDSLTKLFEQFGVEELYKKHIQELFNSNKMNEKEVKEKILEICPKMEHIFKYWNSTPIAKLNLSSVGIIIGAFAVENITKEVFDLSIWI